MTKRIPTGEITPRDYGVVIRPYRGQRKLLAPSKYAFGALLLESPEAIRERIADWARRNDMSQKKARETLEKGIARRGNGVHVLDWGNLLYDAKRHAGAVTAKVTTKSESDEYVEARVVAPRNVKEAVYYDEIACDCAMSFWDGVKTAKQVCGHVAALDIALYRDEKSYLSTKENVTGLSLSQRIRSMMPFTFFAHDKRQGPRWQAVTDMLFDYYVNGHNHFDINVRALDDPEIYVGRLAAAIATDANTDISYEAVRHDEHSVSENTVSTTERRMYGSFKVLEGRIEAMFEDHGFHTRGYVLEFKDTPHEVIARRFVQGFTAYSLCIRRDMPPLLIKKHLGAKVDRPITAAQPSPSNPYGQKESYITVDDATRRECHAEVIIPGTRQHSQLEVSQDLQRIYEKMAEGGTLK
jgi:hypothetical protein